jgi:hypothetical protein
MRPAGGLLPFQHSEGKKAWQALPSTNRPCLHGISPKGLGCGETIQGEWGIWSPGGRPAGAASFLLAARHKQTRRH